MTYPAGRDLAARNPAATSAKSRNGPACSVKVRLPSAPGEGRNPSKKSS